MKTLPENRTIRFYKQKHIGQSLKHFITKKLPLILPLLIDNMFVTDIQTKANIFNTSFTEQCTLLKNSCVLPVTQMFLTQSRLNSIDFNEDEDLKIIRALNIHKAHGHNDISIILFGNSAKSSCFP